MRYRNTPFCNSVIQRNTVLPFLYRMYRPGFLPSFVRLTFIFFFYSVWKPWCSSHNCHSRAKNHPELWRQFPQWSRFAVCCPMVEKGITIRHLPQYITVYIFCYSTGCRSSVFHLVRRLSWARLGRLQRPRVQGASGQPIWPGQFDFKRCQGYGPGMVQLQSSLS